MLVYQLDILGNV